MVDGLDPKAATLHSVYQAPFRSFTRVSIVLPVTGFGPGKQANNDRLAADAVISHFIKEFEGGTYIDTEESPYRGYWLRKAAEEQYGYPVTVSILTIDVACPGSDVVRIKRGVARIREIVFEKYKEQDAVQHEIWIGYQPIIMNVFETPFVNTQLFDVAESEGGGLLLDT